MKKEELYKAYFDILHEELIPAAGCTEPIAIAYAASVARKYLENLPDKILVKVSGNLIKNAKSVVIPNTHGLIGISSAIAAGMVAGNAEQQLEVIASITDKQRSDIVDYLAHMVIDIDILDEGKMLDLIIIAYDGKDYVKVRLSDTHTNIVLIEKNGEILHSAQKENAQDDTDDKRELLSIAEIYDFAKNADIAQLKNTLQHQIDCNMAIAEYGMENQQGAGIGPTIMRNQEQNSKTKAKAMAAAASDARMAGINMPVVIAAGSGNQGISASVPVITYGQDTGRSHEEILRALAFADLAAIHQKTKIGKLSAYCGVICAATGSVAGIAFMENENLDTINSLISNSLGISSGIICDGAKASCAGKISAAIDNAFLSYDLAKNSKVFKDGEGIIGKDIEQTINNVGRLAKDGMRETDKEIINIMINK